MLGHRGDIDDRADRVRRHRAGDEARALRHQRPQIVDVQIAVLAHAPPFELRAGRLQRQPGGDVGVVIHVGDDDLVTFAEHLADAEADQADERGGVHAEADLGRAARVDQQRHAFARVGDRLVDLDAAGGSGRRAGRCGRRGDWSTASSTLCGICAPAALSRKMKSPARCRAGNIERMVSTGKVAAAAVRRCGLVLVHGVLLDRWIRLFACST